MASHSESYVNLNTYEMREDATKDNKRSAVDTLLPQQSDGEDIPVGQVRPARSLLSLGALSELVLDLSVLLAAVYFVAFAVLVYQQDGQPASNRRSRALLEASRYGPTIFPIMFAAVVAKALRSIAAYKLEQGSRVLTIEYLLASRTVFDAVKAPFGLGSFTPLTLLLVVLWALSPLGSQASLRIISTVQSKTNSTAQVSFLNFSSPFINGGPRSASAGSLVQADTIFSSALISPASQKAASQDEFGNIKIPMIEFSSGPADQSTWVNLTQGSIVYSSLTGLPYLGVPGVGNTTFNIETSYMYANCSLSHSSPASPITNFSSNSTSSIYQQYYNGENFLLSWDLNNTFMIQDNPDHQYWVQFESVGGSEICAWEYLTTAYCILTNSFVEVAIECAGDGCHSTSIRKSQLPHQAVNLVPPAGATNKDILYMNYFPDLINATYTEALCDADCCSSSPLEAYLLQPDTPYSISGSSPAIWPIGDELFSQRFSQLLNTYWIDSVAPLILLRNFTIPPTNDTQTSLLESYKVTNATANVEQSDEVIRCNRAWFAVLLLASGIILPVGIGGAILNACRKGPEILTSFSGLLRHSSAVGIEQGSSMEGYQEQAHRLRNVKVRLGDVNPGDAVGFVAIARVAPGGSVRKLRQDRQYG